MASEVCRIRAYVKVDCQMTWITWISNNASQRRKSQYGELHFRSWKILCQRVFSSTIVSCWTAQCDIKVNRSVTGNTDTTPVLVQSLHESNMSQQQLCTLAFLPAQPPASLLNLSPMIRSPGLVSYCAYGYCRTTYSSLRIDASGKVRGGFLDSRGFPDSAPALNL